MAPQEYFIPIRVEPVAWTEVRRRKRFVNRPSSRPSSPTSDHSESDTGLSVLNASVSYVAQDGQPGLYIASPKVRT